MKPFVKGGEIYTDTRMAHIITDRDNNTTSGDKAYLERNPRVGDFCGILKDIRKLFKVNLFSCATVAQVKKIKNKPLINRGLIYVL